MHSTQSTTTKGTAMGVGYHTVPQATFSQSMGAGPGHSCSSPHVARAAVVLTVCTCLAGWQAIGMSVLAQLQGQREGVARAAQTLSRVNQDLDRGDASVKTMTRRANWFF